MSADPEARAKAILARLVAFDSVSDRSNLPLVDFVEDYLRALGVEPRRVPTPRATRRRCWRRSVPMIDGGIVLSGHTDVVPAKGQPWSGDPFALREIDGRLYGRGACDMKGFDAAALAMVPTFQAANLKRPIHLLLSYDEETTCLGSLDVIARFRRRSAASRRRHRRRADDDGGRRRAQGRCDVPRRASRASRRIRPSRSSAPTRSPPPAKSSPRSTASARTGSSRPARPAVRSALCRPSMSA